MDEYTGKRAAGKLVYSRRGSNLSFRDPIQEDRSNQYCSRLGCSNRLNSMKTTQAGNQEKFKYSKASFHPTSSKASSSSSFSSPSDFRKSHQERQGQISLQKNSIAESSIRQGGTEDLRFCNRQELIEDSDTSSRQEETDDSESGLVTPRIQTVLPDSEDLESTILQCFPSSTTEALGSCTLASSSRSRKQINRHLGTSKQESSGSSVRRSFVSRSTTLTVKPVSQGMSAGPQRYGLKNLGCTSISDVLPPRCSSSDSGHNTKVYSIRKRSCDGEGSSTGVRAMSESSSGGYSDSSNSGLSALHPEHSLSQQISRRARNQPTGRDGTVSARTRRAPSGQSRMRFPEQEDGNIVSPSETIVVPRLSQTQFSIPEALPERSSRSFPSERPPAFRSTFGRSGSSSRSARTRSSSRQEGSSTQVIHGPLEDRESYRRFNMEGIAEVLLALERIEQDEELTYEQLLVLETNLFLGGLSFHDQHRDMRMDIDNMSYEELLALEEKMGTVSTALSEEALTKCLKKSIYAPDSMFPGVSSCGDDDIKCIICQEEYVLGDEVGKLACEHRYHATCIDQWLRQKNWCPICKAPACPS